MRRISGVLGIIGIMGLITGCSGGGDKGPLLPPPPVPAEYADKHMPEGWWTDPDIIAEGKLIFTGEANIDVNCASCHGKNGKPVKRGARDFRQAKRMSMYSDSYWFWRISEGVPKTKMKPWKDKLPEEDRWKVLAYEHTFSHEGQPSLHDDYKPMGEPTTTGGPGEGGESAEPKEAGGSGKEGEAKEAAE